MEFNLTKDNTCLIKLPSDMAQPDEQPFLNTCASQSLMQIQHIVLDFSLVEMMNGLGVTMLAKLSTLARRHGQRLMAIGVSDHYRDVLAVTGLDKVISAPDNLKEIVKAVQVSLSEVTSWTTQNVVAKDMSYWAKPVAKLSVPALPLEAMNRNMNGRCVVGPVDGFGRLWQKTYQLRIDKAGIKPENVIKVLKQEFPSFQPSYNRFYATEKGIQPGAVIAIDSSTPGGPVSTGVMVLYADDRSFTFITPQGHPESGWVSFNAFETEDNKIVTQILGLARANDLLYEAAFRTVGSRMQVKIWIHVLTSLATHLGVPAHIFTEAVCVDSRIQWSQIGNVWYNAQIRTILSMPVLSFRRLFSDRPKKEI